MAALADVMGWRAISASIQKVETGIPNRIPSVFTSLTEKVLGDRTTYNTFYGQRQTARRGEYGSQSKARELRPTGDKSVALLHFPEHIKIGQELLMRLRNPNDLLAQEKAQQEIARHGADFRQLFDNTRVAAITSMLANGKIWFDASGNILPSASGAALTIDFGIGANNRNQLNGIIAASWATNTTNIVQHIENLQVQAVKNTGRNIEWAFYGSNIAGYFFANTLNQAFWQFNPLLLQQFQATPGVIPNGTFGIKNWVRMGDSFYNDATDTTQAQWPADQVTFTVDISRNAYTLYEGSILVPKRFGIAQSAEAAIEECDTVYGMGGYALLEADPVGIKQIWFDTFLPHWKNELDMYIADVTP